MPRVSSEHKEARRAHLLHCAERVFLRLGYRRARLQDVMEEAGVSRGGLYDYFANKQELFDAVRTRRDEGALTRLQELSRGDEPVTPFVLAWTGKDDVPDEEALGWIAAQVEYNLEERQNPAYKRTIEQRLERFLAVLTAVLEAGVRRGEFQPELPCATIARFLVVAQDGAAMGRMVLGEAFRADPGYGEALSFFARRSLGIVPRQRRKPPARSSSGRSSYPS
ncbi:MAG: TetR family transcriptional regulator [Thermaerobacter sp.]|nr:TetR family transcriptional regulator [Thermaerobacter sp.]